MKSNCKHCRKKFEQKIFNYRYCEETEDCKQAGKESKNKVIQKAIEKAKDLKLKKSKSETNVLRENLKTLSEWKNDLQKEINSIVREIDKGHPCISSGRALGKSYDAGHFLGRQAFPEARYHLMNIYAQSVEQNQHKSGNVIGFMEGLEQVFGKEHLDLVMALKSLPSLKITIEEIKEAVPRCRGILKWLKLQDRQFTTEERLELRKRFNSEIGIYNNG